MSERSTASGLKPLRAAISRIARVDQLRRVRVVQLPESAQTERAALLAHLDARIEVRRHRRVAGLLPVGALINMAILS